MNEMEALECTNEPERHSLIGNFVIGTNFAYTTKIKKNL